MSDKPKWTDRGEWRVECVSDACRVVTGQKGRKVIVGRFAPPQLPESESMANAGLCSAAPEMAAVLETVLGLLERDIPGRDILQVLCAPDHWGTFPTVQTMILYALAKAKGEL